MPDLVRVWTRDEVLALPDDGSRYELVDGELLVSPSPRAVHQSAVTALFRRIDRYVEGHRLGLTLCSPADLDLDTGQLLQPDLFVVRTTDGRPFLDWRQAGIPLLVVEIVSPSTARFDRVTKRRRYQRSQVPTYWIVDLEARLVEVWAPSDPSPAIVVESLSWQPDPAIPPLFIDLPETFRGIWGE